jgi:hypothetical protein
MGAGFFPGGKEAVDECDHAPLFIAKFKNEWIYTPHPPTCLHGVDRDFHVLQVFLTLLESR